MAEWASDKILGSSFITHSGPNGYEVHFSTPDREKYLAVQEECRRQLGHAKPMTRASEIRQMSDDELAHLFWQISLWRKPATYDTVSGFCLDDGVIKEKEWLDWLKQEVSE